MEATGIEGNYRITCERVLRVLRSNKESLLAVLEAFVYDPLINWRLMDGIFTSLYIFFVVHHLMGMYLFFSFNDLQKTTSVF